MLRPTKYSPNFLHAFCAFCPTAVVYVDNKKEAGCHSCPLREKENGKSYVFRLSNSLPTVVAVRFVPITNVSPTEIADATLQNVSPNTTYCPAE